MSGEQAVGAGMGVATAVVDPGAPRADEGPLSDDPRAVLRERFGFPDFHPGQREVIERVLSGRPVITVMPTGAGKSLCYQLPAVMLRGLTLVVSPLIALMKDQVDGLNARGISATYINSTIPPDERRRRMWGVREGAYDLLYVAPERFRSEHFVEAMTDQQVSLFAVDEAHCISQWGHDFRPDYKRLDRAIELLKPERILACTATATAEVRKDIAAQLGLESPETFVTGFHRPNLELRVEQVGGPARKRAWLAERLQHEAGAGIVYCNTRKNVEAVVDALRRAGVRALGYHAGMPDEDRHRVQELFMGGQIDVVAATNAFGMGVDRSDIRYVIHHDVPRCIESYYQEVGRAGRDRAPSTCTMLFNHGDVSIQEFLIRGSYPPPAAVRGLWDLLRHEASEDGSDGAQRVWVEPGRYARTVPGFDNDMAVDSALRMLQGAGYLSPEHGGAARLCERSDDPEGKLTAVDFDEIAERERRERGRLKRMVDFAYSGACRHRSLLGYFGDRNEIGECEACDNCERDRNQPVTELEDEQRTDVLMVLSCVARMKGRFGKQRVVQVLAGSEAQDIKRVGLHELSTWGLMKGRSREALLDLINACVEAGYIAITGSDYPLVEITQAGFEAATGREPVRMRYPSPRVAESRTPRGRKRRQSSSADAIDEDVEVDSELFEALRQLRLKLAKEQGVPPYVIFHDRTLRALASTKPATLAEMGHIKGVGEAKLGRYGAAFLAVLNG